MDYEKFISEKSAQLEHDKDRDLLLFLRDDVSVERLNSVSSKMSHREIKSSHVQRKERTAVPSVRACDLKEAKWLLTKECLQHYSSPNTLINFNYANFSGRFTGYATPGTLHTRIIGMFRFDPLAVAVNPLRFESDEERNLNQINSNNAFVDAVVKEGYLTVLPGEGIMENIRVRSDYV